MLKQRQDWALPEPKNMIEQDLNEVRILIKEKILALIQGINA
jgi:hypothetical protein